MTPRATREVGATPSPVVITGCGCVTCHGEDPRAVYEAVRSGIRGAVRGDFEVPGRGTVLVGAIEGFDLGRHYKSSNFRRLMSRESALATVAMRDALARAGVEAGKTHDGAAIGLYVGTGATGLDFSKIVRMVDHSVGADGLFDEERFCLEGIRKVHPLLSFQILPNMPPCFASIVHGIRGDHLVFNPWEGNAAQAVLEGWHRVRAGDQDVAVVGGSDVKTHSQAYVFLHQVGLFRRDDGGPGGVPGEGAGYLVLEGEAAARARGAKVLARLLAGRTASDPAAGWGYTEDPARLAGLVEDTLRDGGCDPGRVRLCFTSTPTSDRAALPAEDEALRRVLPGTTLVAPKEALTNTFAAAGPLALVAAVEAIATGDADLALVNAFGNGTQRCCFLLGPGEEGGAHA